MDRIQKDIGAPAASEYVHIDPDAVITGLCHNDNAYRPLANFLNHENFLVALGERRHILFDGTGKDLHNTCGRVISRLKGAGYDVYICIVLASYSTCLDRIAARFKKTGRNVPEKFVRGVFEALVKSVPVYLSNQPALAKAVVVYDNDTDAEPTARVITRDGGDAAEATAFALRMLEMPPPAPPPEAEPAAEAEAEAAPAEPAPAP